VSHILDNVDYVENTKVFREELVNLFKQEKIYQGVGGLSAKQKQNKIQSTMKERYGVANAGQMPGNGWSNNDLEKTEVYFLEQFKEYTEEVDLLTKKNKKQLVVTDYCYYTGIKFADAFSDKVNPNDPLKRSLDHKISKWVGFFTGLDPEEVASSSNLVWCLKYCNSVKNQMTAQQFKPYAEKIREYMIYEGKTSN
jgi:hypothetical protein